MSGGATFFCAAILLGVSSFSPLSQAESAAPPYALREVAFTVNGTRLDTLNIDGVAIPSGGSITFRNGRDGSLLEVASAGPEGGVHLSGLENTSASLAAAKAAEGYATLALTVVNQGSKEVWLEVEVALPFTGKSIRYYNGFEPSDKPGEREGIGGVLPLASLYEEGGKGLALGINPLQIRSYLANGAEWQEGKGALRYRTRMVVPPGKQEEVEWIAFAYDARHGHLDAIQCYQQLFPTRFRLQPDADPSLRGPCYSSLFWRPFNEIYSSKERMTMNRGEVYRRTGPGWDWAYGGYGYRPGDWLATEELTGDWKMRHHPEQVTFREHRKRSATEHLTIHLDAYKRAKPFGIAPLMYLIPTYCEEDLAEELYKDSIYYDEQGRPRTAGPPWVHAYDKCYQMYCYGNSFGDYTFSVLEEILKRAEVQGFAFDCMDRSAYNYFGPGVERSPGTAYDRERGRYANMDTAAALFTRRVHEIKKDGKRMTVTGNVRAHSTSYLVAGEMDAAIIERPPWDQNPRPDLLRLMLGQKSITFLHGYQKLPHLPEDPAELIKLVEGLSDYSLHRSFELGIYLNLKVLSGFPKLFYYQRYAQEFFGDLGWQPVAALKPDHPDLLVARYGNETGAAFFLGNTTPADIETAAQLEHGYLGNGSYLIGDAEGRVAIPNELGTLRYGPIPVVSREPRLLRVYATTPSGVLKEATVDAQLAEASRSRLAIAAEVKKPGEYPITFFIPTGYDAGDLKINGQSIPFAPAEGQPRCITANMVLPAGQVNVELEWLPYTEARGIEEIVKFPFITEEKQAGFAICAESAEMGEAAAERLSWFFGAALNGVGPAAKVLTIPITDEVGKSEKPVIFIGSTAFMKGKGIAVPDSDGQRNGIYRDGNALVIVAEHDAASAVNQLMDLLAPEYPVYGYVSVSKEGIPWTSFFSPTYFTEKTGLNFLPWKRKELVKP